MNDIVPRQINYLRVSITDRCNLRCLYCMPPDGIIKIDHREILRYEEILRIVKVAVAKGICKVRITGGEPLVRKGLVQFVNELSHIPGIQDLSLTTNGILLGEMAMDLFNAGLRSVNVSMDSLDKTRFHEITRGGDLDRVHAGMREAIKVGLSPVKINTVVIRGLNDDEVVDFAKLSIDNPYHVRFIELMPVGLDTGWNQDRYVSSEEVRDAIEGFEKLRPLRRNNTGGPARMFRFEGAAGEVGFISPYSDHFCSSCNRLRLTADGKLRTCLFSDEEVDLKDSLRDLQSDSGLERLIDLALSNKTEMHFSGVRTPKKCSRNMSAIGG